MSMADDSKSCITHNTEDTIIPHSLGSLRYCGIYIINSILGLLHMTIVEYHPKSYSNDENPISIKRGIIRILLFRVLC